MEVGVSERKSGDGDKAHSFLQSDFWSCFKGEHGWTSHRFDLTLDNSSQSSSLLVLVRRIPGGSCFGYVPHGPELDVHHNDRAFLLAELSEKLRPFLPRRCFFIRYDPPWYNLETMPVEEGAVPSHYVDAVRPLVGRPLRRAIADVQPPDTVFVDLRPDEDAILASMKPKWRYNVRLAVKKGVMVEKAGMEAIHEFYGLYRATSRRDRIVLHPESYYMRLFSLAQEHRMAGMEGTPDIRLWMAYHEGQSLAAIITLFLGTDAVYLYGASSNEKRNLMPAYALQWEAMRAAKTAGCTRYDLFGIPPNDDPSHPMSGLYKFKTGFGGTIAHRAGSWDYPLQAPGYFFFRAAERARTWWFKDFKKKMPMAKETGLTKG